MSDHQGSSDETGSGDQSLDAAASDALEARLSTRPTKASDPRVDALSMRMQRVRDTLSDDFDGPSESQMEGMLQQALRSTTTAGSDVANHESGRHDGVVPPTNRRGLRRTRDRMIAAAAALAVVVAGVAVISYSSGTPTDVASPAAGEADRTDSGPADTDSGPADTDSGPADAEANKPAAPGERDDGAAALEDAEAGTDASASSEQQVDSLQAADRTKVLAGLEFTIVVPIVRP